MIHNCSLKVRSYECDAYGHVNNAVYLHYLEYGRIEFLHAIGFDYDRLKASGYGLFVREINIRYVTPAVPGEVLRIETEPVEKKAASGVFRQTITNESEMMVADARVTWTFVNELGKPVRIPPEFENPRLVPDESAAAY
jgi:acyl-CoA thioester hydrolase